MTPSTLVPNSPGAKASFDDLATALLEGYDLVANDEVIACRLKVHMAAVPVTFLSGSAFGLLAGALWVLAVNEPNMKQAFLTDPDWQDGVPILRQVLPRSSFWRSSPSTSLSGGTRAIWAQSRSTMLALCMVGFCWVTLIRDWSLHLRRHARTNLACSLIYCVFAHLAMCMLTLMPASWFPNEQFWSIMHSMDLTLCAIGFVFANLFYNYQTMHRLGLSPVNEQGLSLLACLVSHLLTFVTLGSIYFLVVPHLIIPLFFTLSSTGQATFLCIFWPLMMECCSIIARHWLRLQVGIHGNHVLNTIPLVFLYGHSVRCFLIARTDTWMAAIVLSANCFVEVASKLTNRERDAFLYKLLRCSDGFISKLMTGRKARRAQALLPRIDSMLQYAAAACALIVSYCMPLAGEDGQRISLAPLMTSYMLQTIAQLVTDIVIAIFAFALKRPQHRWAVSPRFIFGWDVLPIILIMGYCGLTISQLDAFCPVRSGGAIIYRTCM